MLDVIDTTKAMQQTLQTYLCSKVWNTPLTECRRNITLRAITKGRSAISSLGLGCTTIALPYSNSSDASQRRSFFVYAAAKCCMGGIIVDTEQDDLKEKLKDEYNSNWLPLDKYLNVRPFDLRIHGINGEWMYRNQVFIRNHPYQDLFLIAVETKMARQILGNDYNFFNMLMSVYYDSDHEFNIDPDNDNLVSTSPMIKCYHPTAGDVATLNKAFNAYYNLSTEDKNKTLCFIDGHEATPLSLTDIEYGQYVELVYDPDIICNITLDLTNPDDSNIYRSTIDDTYKYLVHIPKSYNPDNLIITHNTCDLFIRPINPAEIVNARLKGLFIHRFDTSKIGSDGYLEDHVITQITHNDFGVSEKLLMPYMKHIGRNTAHGSSECLLRVVVRKHSKTNVLQDDANFLKILYQFDDSTIIDFLRGNDKTGIDFWKAAYLEAQPFAKMFMEVPHALDDTNTAEYIKALGYYNSLSIITPRVVRSVKLDTNIRKFDVELPISMLSCDRIGLFVYINGLKINNSFYSYNRNNQYVTVTLDGSVEFEDGDDLNFELFDAHKFRAEEIKINTAQHNESGGLLPDQNIFKVNEPFNVYRVFDLSDEDGIPSEYYNDKYIVESNKSYYKLSDDEINDLIPRITYVKNGEEISITRNNIKNGTTYTLYFSEEFAERTYLITSKNVYQRFDNEDISLSGGNTSIGETGDDILHSGKLMIDVTTWDGSEEYKLPLIDHEWSSIVFMNGKELVRDIDFSYRQIFSNRGGVIYSEMFFNNISYLKNDSNDFELFVSSDHEFMNYHGFLQVFYNTTTSSTTFLYGAIEEVNPFVFWFDRLCTLSIDGYNRADMKKEDGYLKVYKYSQNSGNRYQTRQGALYYTRGLVPLEAVRFVDNYWNNTEDIRKMHLICQYLKLIAPELPTDRVLLQKSHHITSITMSALIHDVLNGTKRLSYEPDASMMSAQVEEYLSLRKYDTAMTGIASELTLIKAGISHVNNVYRLTDPEAKGLNRKWVNNVAHVKVWWNCDRKTKRWEIVSTIGINPTVYYYANDPDGSHDPWTLKWKSVSSDNNPVPELLNGMLDLRYIDLFPSYSSDLHVVADDRALRQAMIALFPVDAIRDGDTTT